MTTSPGKKLSIVIPAFNEAANLSEVVARLDSLQSTLEARGVATEVVLIDDHSSDATPAVCRRLAQERGNLRYWRLARNCGAHVACAAGLDHCTGDAAVIMAADLQDPPEVVSALVAAWEQGNDVVWAVRSAREGEARSTLLSSWLFNSLMRTAFPDLPRQGADFVLVSRRVIDAFNAIGERNNNINLAIRWLGFRQASIEYVKQARHAGRSGFSLAKKIKVAIDSIVSYSYAPIRLISVAGLVLVAAGLVGALGAIIGWFCGLAASAFWVILLASLLLSGQGAILTALGILGEYTWRTLDEVRGRPRYVIEESSEPIERDPPAGPRRMDEARREIR